MPGSLGALAFSIPPNVLTDRKTSPSLQVNGSYKNGLDLSRWAEGLSTAPQPSMCSDTVYPTAPRKFWYAWGTMSALNGDKARFNRERSQAIRQKLKDRTPPRATGTQL